MEEQVQQSLQVSLLNLKIRKIDSLVCLLILISCILLDCVKTAASRVVIFTTIASVDCVKTAASRGGYFHRDSSGGYFHSDCRKYIWYYAYFILFSLFWRQSAFPFAHEKFQGHTCGLAMLRRLMLIYSKCRMIFQFNFII